MSASFWWVNHSHTVRHEIEGAYLWFANKARKSKARSESDKNIQRLLPADVVYSFADGAIGAVGVVLGSAREAAKPLEFDSIAEYADTQAGWQVPVRFMTLANSLRTEKYGAELAPVLPRKHPPILAGGASNQHVVLASVPPLMAATLSRLLGGEVERIVGTITESVGRSLAEDAAEGVIQQRTDIGPAQKADLLKARHGQGVFRANLELNEHSCRITGVLDRRHLWATHIMPWSECDDAQKLDGSNGLLMSPHVAHLFERGYISFLDDGGLLVSQELNPVVLDNWHIQLPLNVGEFRPEQCYFLEYHRHQVFQQHGAGRRQRATEHLEAVPVVPTAEPATVQPL
ncbi:MAG: HNH endonuclease [Steroidobacteraceae bacterium]